MTSFQPFAMERYMSKYEQAVDYNLSDSGVHPLMLSELLGEDPAHLKKLLATEINYAHANGNPDLRQNIAALYKGATQENVLVTTGAIEANYNTLRALVAPGEEIIVMLPNYMQIWGIARNSGLNLKTFHLSQANDWAPDMAELEENLTERTKLIAICNPNNPTGRILTTPEMDKIISLAARSGAWILADEVYAGAERLTDVETPSFYGCYDKVMAVGSLSKAYGLPGLRIGWVAGPAEAVDAVWAWHEYNTLSASIITNQLAALALSPEIRPRILRRTREYIRRGYPVLQRWMARHPGTFSLRPPEAAAIAFVRYQLDMNSSELVDRLRREKSVLIVPGDHFGLDHYVRISFGLPHDYLEPGLERCHELLQELS